LGILNLTLIDSTIIAAVVSTAVSIAVFVISDLLIQPRRWKKNLQVENLEKRLETYGALLTIIDSMAEKSKRHGSKAPFTMENPFDYEKILAIVENKSYLLSEKLSQSWLKLILKDKYFSLYNSLKKGEGLTGANFGEMQKIAKQEYEELKEKYCELTGITF
jgi:hypothetical protein